jgi:hypothetical protein
LDWSPRSKIGVWQSTANCNSIRPSQLRAAIFTAGRRKAMRLISLLFPRTQRRLRQGWFIFFSSVALALVLLGISMIANHRVVLLAFGFTGFFGTMAAWVFFDVLTSRARKLWTYAAFFILMTVLFAAYVDLCPNLVVRPEHEVFTSSDDLYLFTVTNPTDTDLYANAFIFHLEPDDDSFSDFELRVEPRFLRPLEQQSKESTEKVSDIFGFSGEDSLSHPILILYIYHLPPHDSREIGMKFNGYTAPNILARVRVTLMSYSDSPLPISKKEGDIVALPIGLEQPLEVDGIFHCLLDSRDSELCSFQRFHPEGQISTAGCYYIAFVKGRNMPNSLPSLNAGSCDIRNIRTHNFTIW